MTDKYEAPFEGGKTPDPNRKAKVKNIAKNLARKAMKKAASKPVEEGYMKKTVSDDDSGMSDYEHYMQTRDPKTGLTGHQLQQRKAMDAADFKKRREEMNAKRQAGTKPLSTTYKEEVELDEAFINGREYASHGLMHPKHAGEPIHRVADHYVDFYASGTGDKMQGKVKLNDGKSVHIQAHPKMGDGKLHKFKVSTDLPKMTNEAKDDREYDYEGDMAMSQLKSVIANAQKLHDMLDPDTNLPEWVQSKITLAEDYIVTAANYMDGEMNEEVEQVEEGLVGSLVRAYISPKAQRLVGHGVKKVVGKLGASAQTQRRLQKVGMNWAKSKIGEEAEQIEEKKMGYEKLASAIKSRAAKKKLAVEAHDPVGKEDADINNDGKVDKTDVYLHTKRRAIGKAISTRLATKAGK